MAKKKGRYLDTKEHKDWRAKVIARDGACVICGATGRLTGHHLIQKNIKKLRSNIMNGVTLCGRHHAQYGYCLSPHNDASFMFAIWMMKNRPELFKWVEDNWEYGL